MPNVLIVDYGMGNLWSVFSALQYIGCHPAISSDPNEIGQAPMLVLPGVGSFNRAMKALSDRHLDTAILEAVQIRRVKILGICLGMQLLGTVGCEHGQTLGLGLIPQAVEPFDLSRTEALKIPHVGFNEVWANTEATLFKKLPINPDFYFVHSYRMAGTSLQGRKSFCEYGEKFLAAYEADNIYATQFHPEKSQMNGLVLLRNFIKA